MLGLELYFLERAILGTELLYKGPSAILVFLGNPVPNDEVGYILRTLWLPIWNSSLTQFLLEKPREGYPPVYTLSKFASSLRQLPVCTNRSRRDQRPGLVSSGARN